MAALWAVAGAVLLVVGHAAARTRRPLLQVLLSALCGVGALAAVDLLAPATGVYIAVNPATSFAAAVLGVPGVVCLLALDLILL